MAHITLQQLTTVLQRIVSWSSSKFAAKNQYSGKLDHSQAADIVLSKMTEDITLRDAYYYRHTDHHIVYIDVDGERHSLGEPVKGLVYYDAENDKFVRWVGVSVDVPTGWLGAVSNKADLLSDILSPSQWPRMIIGDVNNVNPMNISYGVGEMKISRLENGVPVLSMWTTSMRWVEIGVPIPGFSYLEKKTGDFYRYDYDNHYFIKVSSSGLSPGANGIHIGTNGNWWLGPETDPANDTGVHAQGPQGETGSVTVSDGVAEITIVNDLTTGGGGKALSAEMGKRLKSKINEVYGALQSVYAALAGMAFTDGKSPATLPDLDWSIPKHAMSFDIDGHAVVSINSTTYEDGNAVQVEEGETIELVIAPAAGYLLSATPTVTVGGDSVLATPNGDGTYSAEVTMGTSNIVVAIDATTTVVYAVEVSVKEITGTAKINENNTAAEIAAIGSGYGTMSPTPPVMTVVDAAISGVGVSCDNYVAPGGTLSGNINIPSGYGLFSAKIMMGGVDKSNCIDFETLTFSVQNVSAAVEITITVAEAQQGMFIGKSYHDNYPVGTPGALVPNYDCIGNLIAGDAPANTGNTNDAWCCMSMFKKIPSSANKIKLEHGLILTQKKSGEYGDIQNRRGCLMVYDEYGVPVGHITIYNANETQRELAWQLAEVSNASKTGVYVRGSFIVNKLGSSGISYSTNNGSTYTKVFDGANIDQSEITI